MKYVLIFFALLTACGDNEFDEYPACGGLRCTAISCEIDGPLCTCELDTGAVTCDSSKYAPSPCCDLLPDENAVRACELPPPPGTCGVIACPLANGTFQRINFCGPPL
jgi:hypothetical protein